MPRTRPSLAIRRRVALAAAATALVSTSTAAFDAARMQLPPGLDAGAAEVIEGLSAGREGRFALGAGDPHRGSFKRGADRLTLMERLRQDKASVAFTLEPAGAAPMAGRCELRARSALNPSLEVPLGRGTVACTFEMGAAAPARLDLAAVTAATGTRAERRGELRFAEAGAERVLQVRSVHRVEGSPLPLEAPIGYVISDGERAVGAVEVNGRRPRVWRPPAGTPAHEAVTRAAIALALLWDPSQQP